MIPYTTVSVWYLLMGIPRIYRSSFCLKISIPDLNLVSLLRSYHGDWSFKELLMDENARRLQDVVDKGPWLICRDDQATYAITVGTRGHKTCKVNTPWTRGHKIVGDIVFRMPCFLNFLWDLNPTTPTINIDLLICDCFLPLLVVDLFLSP